MQTALNRFELRTLYNTDPSELQASLPALFAGRYPKATWP